MSRGDRMTSDLNRTGTVERDIEQIVHLYSVLMLAMLSYLLLLLLS
ncbi:hypothetical protein Lalb_Chr04g0249171 [Lupinus albus]|uniref:Uncharacterized protein n=1 Tax=Lupinus albus TaxID=3870 RepID=A0A6A4QLJ6_LUPAL|nr:hypothetical protein Lalb_Chr04g0249171 [Lupinus albus]